IVETVCIGLASPLIERDFHMSSRFSIDQLQFTYATWFAVLLTPELDKQKLVAEISDVLQRTEAIGVIEEVRDDDGQPTLRVGTQILARQVKVIRFAFGLQLPQIGFGGLEPMAAAARDASIEQAIGERLKHDAIEPHKPHVHERGSELAGVI